eukprot:Ihof_evm3s766 gene=Ihof_evmTU3s766
MQAKDSQHLLILKVMRLSKPTFAENTPLLLETSDIAYKAFQHSNEAEGRRDDIALTDTLNLPQNFGNIYLGEKFISYIRVSNDSNKQTSDVTIK